MLLKPRYRKIAGHQDHIGPGLLIRFSADDHGSALVMPHRPCIGALRR
jgi:hypothetical protein